MKLYGNIDNRFDENKNFLNREIRVGDDVTEYLWSDRHAYFVTKVVSQTNVFIHRYHVCADHSKKGGMGHQDWMYFKTANEMNRYLNGFFPDKPRPTDVPEPKDIELELRNGKWRVVERYDLARYHRAVENAPNPQLVRYSFDGRTLTDRQFEKVLAGKEVKKYGEQINISFGVRDYFLDWEF